ncbi:hypothetical protein FGIG_00151 [Fasciola gigantica]|uniref:Uncharacterized protein n=1 Tax=Fasciola gigantica TaxID=46835 RepID=A0A504WSD5_FASGI|nr:hypothetical protein FGIG_00151 [Fasciola gigantica]
MNPTSPTLDESYTGYDDTQICSPFLSESQLNLTTRTDGSEEIESAVSTNIPADVSSTSETLDIPFFPTLISSSISGPSFESAIADRSSSGPSEQQFFIKKPGVTQTDPPYTILNSVSSSEICSLDEPIPLSLVDFPTPEMLTTLERNITQPHVDQSRFSGGPIAQLDMPSNLSIDSKPIIKSEEFYAPELHEENVKTLGIIRPLVEDRPMSETVQAVTVYNLPKSLALTVLGLAPLQSSSRPLAAVETSPAPSRSIMIKQCDKNSTGLARSQGSLNSTLESNVVAVEAAESVNSFQTTASTIAETKLANTTAKLTPNTEVENYLESLLCVKRVPRPQPNRFHDRPVTRESERNHHLQPPVCSSGTLRPRIMSQTMATSWSPTGLMREVNRQAPRSASTSPLVARKIYLNHITGGALWSFQESSACLPHSCTHSGLVVETETWSNEDRPIWCVGSSGSLNRKVVSDYENMEKWPWPPRKQDVGKLSF